MNEVQQQYYSNNTYKRTISKVTTAKSSCKQSVFDEELEGLIKSKHFETLHPI